MIWSFIKIAVFLAIAAGLAFGASYLMNDPSGEVRIAFGGQEFSLSPIVFALIVAVAFLSLFVILKIAGVLIALLKFVNGDETALSRFFDKNRERKGFEALSESIIALAAGDGRTAMAKATKAERFLDRPELTQLVNAQAADMSGNKERAQEHFKQLLKDERTRFVGVRGLMKQKLAEGDSDTALELAKKAFAINPTHKPTLEALFQMQTDKSDWAGARDTLQARIRGRALPKDVGKRRDAVLNLAYAKAEREDGDTENALESVLKANKAAPGLVPAAVLLAQMKTEAGDKRGASSVLKKAWGQNPHPDLAAAFAAVEPNETSDERLKRFAPFIKAQNGHAEARMLEAELYLAAEDFPAARKALGDLAETDPTARSLAILAAVERGSGADEAVVSGWLAKAVTASRGNGWVCENCRTQHSEWGPVCGNCSSFDTIAWTDVPQSEDQKTMAAAMLPLIVGDRIEAEVDDDAVEDAIVDGEVADAPIDADETQERQTAKAS